MTRFARAKGSKSSNERLPESSTPWKVMKEEMQRKQQESEENKEREKMNKVRQQSYDNFLKQQAGEVTTKWAEFPDDENTKSNKKQNGIDKPGAGNKNFKKGSKKDPDHKIQSKGIEKAKKGVKEMSKMISKKEILEMLRPDEGIDAKVNELTSQIVKILDKKEFKKNNKKEIDDREGKKEKKKNVSMNQPQISKSVEDDDAPVEVSAKIAPSPVVVSKKKVKKTPIKIKSVTETPNIEEINENIAKRDKITVIDKTKEPNVGNINEKALSSKLNGQETAEMTKSMKRRLKYLRKIEKNGNETTKNKTKSATEVAKTKQMNENIQGKTEENAGNDSNGGKQITEMTKSMKKRLKHKQKIAGGKIKQTEEKTDDVKTDDPQTVEMTKSMKKRLKRNKKKHETDNATGDNKDNVASNPKALANPQNKNPYKRKHNLSPNDPSSTPAKHPRRQTDANEQRTNRNEQNDRNGRFPKKELKLKVAKVRDEEHQRRKPDEGPIKILINGSEVDVVKFEGFPIRKEDAERLTELKKQMISKGIPRSEVKRSLQLERRRAEKMLARLKKSVCFQCRKSGHMLSECPEVNDKQIAFSGSGICYKCGSTEHTHFECKVHRGDEYKFASCFICREQGHIARQCPDNPKGLYPQGGACKQCGDVTHLKKDCPELMKEKDENTMFLKTISGGNIDCLDDDLSKPLVKEQTVKNKVVKF